MNVKKDKIRFAQVMASLSEVFDPGRDISALKTEIYFKVLEKFRIEEIEKAASILIGTRTLASFPKPAEIIGLMQPKDVEPRIDKLEAWGMVMSGLEMDRVPNDYGIQKAIRRLGGWDYLKGKSYDELHWLEKRFIEHYEQIDRGDELERICQRSEAELLGLVKKLPEID
jgi:hypothetical protein